MSVNPSPEQRNRITSVPTPTQIHLISPRTAQFAPLVQHLHATGAVVQQHATDAAFRAQPDTRADLLLLDAALPDTAAISLCRDLRQNGGAHPLQLVLILGSSTHPDECVQAFAAGADDYISPPFAWDAVLARINAHLQRGMITAHLQQSATLYRTLINAAWNLVYLQAPDGSLIYCSPSSAALTGYTADELRQNPVLLTEIVHPADRERIHALQQAHAQITPTKLEYRIITTAGETRWMLHSQQNFYAADGSRVGLRVSLHDITQRKQAEYELRQFQQAVEQSPVSIVLTDPHGTIQYVNPHLSKLPAILVPKPSATTHEC